MITGQYIVKFSPKLDESNKNNSHRAMKVKQSRNPNSIKMRLLHLCAATTGISRMRPTSAVQNWIKQV